MYVCMYMYARLYICMYDLYVMYVCMYARLYVSMYV